MTHRTAGLTGLAVTAVLGFTLMTTTDSLLLTILGGLVAGVSGGVLAGKLFNL